MHLDKETFFGAIDATPFVPNGDLIVKTERDIRPFTTGRKNWLFADTVAGAQASAIITA